MGEFKQIEINGEIFFIERIFVPKGNCVNCKDRYTYRFWDSYQEQEDDRYTWLPNNQLSTDEFYNNYYGIH